MKRSSPSTISDRGTFTAKCRVAPQPHDAPSRRRGVTLLKIPAVLSNKVLHRAHACLPAARKPHLHSGGLVPAFPGRPGRACSSVQAGQMFDRVLPRTSVGPFVHLAHAATLPLAVALRATMYAARENRAPRTARSGRRGACSNPRRQVRLLGHGAVAAHGLRVLLFRSAGLCTSLSCPPRVQWRLRWAAPCRPGAGVGASLRNAVTTLQWR